MKFTDISTIFRADSSRWIGAGHVMRCLALAEELRARGKFSAFICSDYPGNISDRISDSGFPLILLDSKPGGMNLAGGPGEKEFCDQAINAREVLSQIRALDLHPDWLVVDHYGLDSRWEQRFSGKIPNILVVDDLADRPHNCDLLLDQNLPLDPEGRYKSLVPPGCEVLLGPKYALLNPVFAETRRLSTKRLGPVKKVLVSLGGTDPFNLTEVVTDSILAVVEKPGFGDFQVDVVLGPGFADWTEKRLKYSSRPRVTFLENVKNLASLMADADLMVGTAGTTTWERMALNLPSITLVVAENQRENGKALLIGNYAKVMDCLDGFDIKSFSDLFKSLAIGDEKLADSPPDVDGLGCSRVADLMITRGIRLRGATTLDARLLFSWANEPGVREASLNSDRIPWETHVAWLDKKLSSQESSVFLIGEDLSGCPIGTVRFEETDSVWTINYSVDHSVRGKGWGGKLLGKGLEFLKANRKVAMLRAQVKHDNQGSRRIFEKLGFVVKVDLGSCLEYWQEPGELLTCP